MIFHKETFFQETSVGKIPRDWYVQTTGKVGEVVTGITPSTFVKEYWNGEYPFVTPTDMTSKKYVEKTERKVTARGIEKGRLVPKDSVLVTCIASIGKMALAFEDCLTNQQINSIICKKGVNPHYVYYALKLRTHILQNWAGRTTNPIIKKSLFEKFPISLPENKSEQKMIAEVLSCVDLAIQKTDEVIAKTERLKTGLMQQLLTKGIGHKNFQDTVIGKIPKEWKLTRLGKILDDVRYGTSTRANINGIGLPVLGTPNILGGKIDEHDLRYVELPKPETEKLKLENGDILLVRTNANPDYIGRCALFEKNNGTWLYASYLIRIRPDRKKVLPEYLVWFLQADITRNQFLRIARTSAGNYNINSQEIRSINISLPMWNEQQKIAEILSVSERKLELHRTEKTKLERVKLGLMDLLLSGKIRIKVD